MLIMDISLNCSIDLGIIKWYSDQSKWDKGDNKGENINQRKMEVRNFYNS